MTLAGARVVLRDWIIDDLETFKYWSEPHHAWHRLDGPYYPRPTGSQLEEYIEKIRQKVESQSFENPRGRMVIATTESNHLIGTVNAYWESVETQWLCCGIVLFDEREWGKGLGYEALKLWGNYLFEAHPDIVRLDLRTWSGNKGMMRLAEKLGFQQEACFRKARIVDGEHYDGLGYGVLREEWVHFG